MKEAVRYGEAFKLRFVEDIAGGKYTSVEEARRKNGISGFSTVSERLKRYGREDILPKMIKAGTMNGIDEMRAARSRIREPGAA
ncbi:MAG: hypothetical protein LBH50_06100, partial [Spirochaetaceae bacterium]|nr:hypothetical protein [Spirochaetaceae bacterium]